MISFSAQWITSYSNCFFLEFLLCIILPFRKEKRKGSLSWATACQTGVWLAFPGLSVELKCGNNQWLHLYAGFLMKPHLSRINPMPSHTYTQNVQRLSVQTLQISDFTVHYSLWTHRSCRTAEIFHFWIEMELFGGTFECRSLVTQSSAYSL